MIIEMNPIAKNNTEFFSNIGKLSMLKFAAITDNAAMIVYISIFDFSLFHLRRKIFGGKFPKSDLIPKLLHHSPVFYL